jgi:hypothetical protein
MNTAVLWKPESQVCILHYRVDNRLQLRTLKVYENDDYDNDEENSNSNLKSYHRVYTTTYGLCPASYETGKTRHIQLLEVPY